jgi:ribonuclease E
MLVQVTKEERGNKGAALTTYLSLAGRYCVLMPNTARGGGVSRKITSLSDRRRLKEILEELEIPEGMGVIVRTAGAERSKAEIKRDYEYLLRLWNEIRELTLRSTAPALIYEEGDLIKRSIRDLYTRDIDEVLVEGEEGYRSAKAFMKMLMPSHAKRVQPYRDPQIGLLHRFQVESQIDAIHSPVVQLRSGGYVVIDQTEALVAIDVNSGRATRERNIEETALRTNLEASEEIARQLRLRDLAGLIVIDFIDMEEHRNQAAVERRLKEALRNDRARIQVGRISPFGLLEMSRQRLRSSLAEASTQPCPHCGGTGFIRSTESTALYVLRSIEEEGMRRRSVEVCVYVPTTVALYILNHKRDSLAQLETRYGVHVLLARDDSLIPPAFRLERLRAVEPTETAMTVSPPLTQTPDLDEDGTEELDETGESESPDQSGPDGEEERVRARRRRRRRRRHDDERGRAPAATAGDAAEEPLMPALANGDGELEGEDDGDGERLRRRRGRRGGRRRARREDTPEAVSEIGRPAAESIEIVAIDSNQSDVSGVASGELAAIAPTSEDTPSLVPQSAHAEIETASLPALTGETFPPPAVELAPTSPKTATMGDERREPDASPRGEPSNDAANPPPEAFGSVISAGSEEANRSNEQDSMPLQATPGQEPADETQFPSGQSAPPSESEPKEIVQEVTKKPENPRRGWWQRLIQS